MKKIDSNGPVLEAVSVDVFSTWNNHIQIAGIDWKVLPGEFWLIGGPHGSGKTDLLMTAAGLRRPAAGSMQVFGREPARMSETELLQLRTRLGFVFKGGGRMFNELTVAENVSLALCYHRNWPVEQAWDEVRAVLEITELAPMAGETAQQLGEDWQQRVGLARALALKPEVLFLDEPAAGLEARHCQWWRDFLEQLSAGGPGSGGRKVTVIAATNDFAPWLGESRRYALIKDHRWQLLGEQSGHPKID
ncbi:MAG: ATP-binding cassette domain-containing protein [Verrucomicrobiota bacterium]|jgi:ABC-type transporter Mla maintaining outer membrane lipid asymmetry ATPase subunit MlaF